MPCEAIATYIEEVNKKNIGNLKLDSVRGIACLLYTSWYE